MFKSMMIALALTSSAAMADTATLQTPAGGFGALHQYHNVGTDIPGLTVTLYMSRDATNGKPYAYVMFSDETANPPDTNAHWIGDYDPSGATVTTLTRIVCSGPETYQNGSYSQQCIADGHTGTIQLTESSKTVKGSCSGRGGCASHTVWTLNSGVIERD